MMMMMMMMMMIIIIIVVVIVIISKGLGDEDRVHCLIGRNCYGKPIRTGDLDHS